MTQQNNIEQLKQVAREKLHTAGVDGFAIDLDLEALDEIVTSTYLQAVEDITKILKRLYDDSYYHCKDKDGSTTYITEKDFDAILQSLKQTKD